MTTYTSRLTQFLAKGMHSLYINGGYDLVERDDVIEVVNPADEAIIGKVVNATREDVDRAVTSSLKAFDRKSEWRKMAADDRAAILYRLAQLIDDNRDTLAQLITLENGKLLKDALSSDVGGAAKTFRYYAGWVTKSTGKTLELSQPLKPGQSHFAYTKREPIGVVAAIVPWNFPLSIAAWKIAPALAAGCTVVLKPSEDTPLSALLLAELGTEAGLPAGVLNVVTGDGPSTGSALTAHRGISKITFTGSTATGRIIGKAAMDNITDISLELGGKSPAIVFDDAGSIDLVAKGVAAGIFRNQGQVCVAGSRVLIQRKTYEELLDKIIIEAKKMKISHGFDADADIGPLVSATHHKKVIGMINQGQLDGNNLLTGGSNPFDKGYFMEPTVFASHDPSSMVCRDEIFGPVLVALPFDSLEDAITMANDSALGLAATVWTQDITKAMTAIDQLEAGVVYVNSPVRSDPNLPLGGVKQSGIGRELGEEGFYTYTRIKSVNIVF